MLFRNGARETIFFRDWMVETEDNILRMLEQRSVSNTIVTMACEMQKLFMAIDMNDEKIMYSEV